MNKISILSGIFAISSSAALAATVDFEDTPAGTPDPFRIAAGTGYVKGDITFSSTEQMQLVGIGLPRNAFVPNDQPGLTPSNAPTDFGNWFLSGDFNDNTDMNLAFGSAMKEISFEIVDIDGDGAGKNELFTFKALFNGTVVSTTSIQATQATPDAQVDTIAFNGIGWFDEIQITGTTTGGTRNIGWGIDNITISPVPLPAGGLLLLGALGGLGAMRARKRRS